MKKGRKFEIAFLIIALLTILEFTFVRGLFTWLIVVAATILVGSINVIFKLVRKEWIYAGLYTVCTIALCMGYFAII